jgi:CheY-like chemotaxis protein
MPELDGYQVVENVRMKMSSSEIMLIASSGWGQQKNKDRAAEAGFDYHLTKPLEYSELRKIIASSSRVVWRQDQIPNDDENVPQTR